MERGISTQTYGYTSTAALNSKNFQSLKHWNEDIYFQWWVIINFGGLVSHPDLGVSHLKDLDRLAKQFAIGY
jgi:hypothetical protein